MRLLKLKYTKMAVLLMVCTGIVTPKIFFGQKNNLSSYSNIFFKSSKINSEYSYSIGGAGAVVLHNKFGLGAFGNGMLGKNEFSSISSTNMSERIQYLKYGYGGVFVEYFLVSNQRIRISTPVKLGLGSIGTYASLTDYKIGKSRIWVLEPELHLDLKVVDHLAISLQGSYRFTDIKSMAQISDETLTGFSIGLGLKFIPQLSKE